MRKTPIYFINKKVHTYGSDSECTLVVAEMEEIMKDYAREKLKDFYVHLVAQGKFLETNPFDCGKPVDEFLKYQ